MIVCSLLITHHVIVDRDASAASFTASVAVSDEIGVRTILASTDVEIVVDVVDGETIINRSAASFTVIVAVSDEIGFRSASASIDVEIVVVVVVVVVVVRIFHRQGLRF